MFVLWGRPVSFGLLSSVVHPLVLGLLLVPCCGSPDYSLILMVRITTACPRNSSNCDDTYKRVCPKKVINKAAIPATEKTQLGMAHDGISFLLFLEMNRSSLTLYLPVNSGPLSGPQNLLSYDIVAELAT